MSDRRQELLRQQTLLREHLAWLDKELADETEQARPPPVLAPPDSITQHSPLTSPQDADALLENYAARERHDPAVIRRGCFTIFAVALATLVIGVAAVYLLHYADR